MGADAERNGRHRLVHTVRDEQTLLTGKPEALGLTLQWPAEVGLGLGATHPASSLPDPSPCFPSTSPAPGDVT